MIRRRAGISERHGEFGVAGCLASGSVFNANTRKSLRDGYVFHSCKIHLFG